MVVLNERNLGSDLSRSENCNLTGCSRPCG
jgi:hypothetical protein